MSYVIAISVAETDKIDKSKEGAMTALLAPTHNEDGHPVWPVPRSGKTGNFLFLRKMGRPGDTGATPKYDHLKSVATSSEKCSKSLWKWFFE